MTGAVLAAIRDGPCGGTLPFSKGVDSMEAKAVSPAILLAEAHAKQRRTDGEDFSGALSGTNQWNLRNHFGRAVSFGQLPCGAAWGVPRKEGSV